MSDVAKCPFCEKYIDNTLKPEICPKCRKSLIAIELRDEVFDSKFNMKPYVYAGLVGLGILVVGGGVLSIIDVNGFAKPLAAAAISASLATYFSLSRID